VKALLELVIAANAVLFFFGAVQHAGVAVGRFHEPQIIPAAIVETTCGVDLVWGATALATSIPLNRFTHIRLALVHAKVMGEP
jgi:hypothetical protein